METPTTDQLAAWAIVRAIWKKNKGEVTEQLLDAEWDAANA